MSGHSLRPLISSLKVRVTALLQHGKHLYVGCADGTLHVYTYLPSSHDSLPHLSDPKIYSLTRRPIDQLGFLDGLDQLVVLSDAVVTLCARGQLGTKSGIQVLTQARTAHAFGTTSYLASKNSRSEEAGIGKLVKDLLVIGCRKKVIVYGAGKDFLDYWELSLPHSPRQVIFPSVNYASIPETIHLLYTPTTSVLLHLDPSAASSHRLSVREFPTNATPFPSSRSALAVSSIPIVDGGASGLASGVGNALTGLGGYVMGKGPSTPIGCRTVGGEVVIAREGVGVFYSSEGNYTRDDSLHWEAAPEAIAFANPYIYSVFSTLPHPQVTPIPAIEVHLAPTLALQQVIPFPQPSVGTLAIRTIVTLPPPQTPSPTPSMNSNATNRSNGAMALIASTPTDKVLAQQEGSTIWVLSASDRGEQVDSLIREGKLADAIGLVEALGDVDFGPRRSLTQLRTLQAVTRFAKGEYKSAFETFTTSSVNVALVVSLFPAKTISGSLHVPREGWMELFGAVKGARLEPISATSTDGAPADGDGPGGGVVGAGLGRGLLKSVPHLTVGLGRKGSVETLRTSGEGGSEDETKEDGDKLEKTVKPSDTTVPREAIQELMFFLSDRRQKVTGAITSLASPLPPETSLPSLSSLPPSELHDLPSVPLTQLEPEQLVRVAQVVYTSLLKVYLIARPSLVGSLCRIENWCDVEEVEGLLREQKRFDDLKDLYMQKKLHAKALSMLHELAQEEDDPLDRHPPTVRYLQKLGPTHLQLIFEWSKWIFKEDSKKGLQIFTADEPEVDALPHDQVVNFLENIDQIATVGYLEHVTKNLGDESVGLHDKLAELYLAQARASGNDEKLLDFLNTSTSYRPYRILNKLTNSSELPAARAILLGRMGRHDEALSIYVHQLSNYTAAEAYCSRVYTKEPDPHGIFLLLLRLYLVPPSPYKPLLPPALSLLATHGTRVDTTAVLDLVPPLVSMEGLGKFLSKSMRSGYSEKVEGKVLKGLIESRKGEIERLVMALEVKRVRVTDQRICPQCHKRLGQSAIAVHAPRGEVTHLHCKDQFSARLAKMRE